MSFPALSFLAEQFFLLAFTATGWGYWVWLVGRERSPSGRFRWLWCGLIGFCANMLFLQVLVYADLPLRYSAWYGLIVAAGGVAAFVVRCLRGGARLLRASRRDVLALGCVGLLAIGLQGWALGRCGAREYFGRARYDLATYVQTAQFLVDEPFSLDESHIGLRPWLARGLAMKGSRLTQSVAQGYLAVVAGSDAQQAYGALSVFCAILPGLCAFAILRLLSLGRLAAALGALWVAWLPAVAHIHLENYLSQAMVLMVFPALSGLWLESRGELRLGVFGSAILLGFLFGAYPEYFPFGCAALFFVLLFTPGLGWRKKLGGYAVILAGALLADPYFTFIAADFVRVQLQSAADPAFLASLAVESGTWRGWVRNFFDFAGLSQGACAAIAVGLGGIAFGSLGGGNSRRRRFVAGIILTPCLASLAMLAFPELPKYPFAKLTASFAGVFALVVILGLQQGLARLCRPGIRRARPLLAGVLALGLIASAAGTWRQQDEVVRRGYFVARVDGPAIRAARTFLTEHPRATYLLGGRDPLALAWLCFFARGSDVYVADDAVGDIGLYSELFWCRRIPAGLKSVVQVDSGGALSFADYEPSPVLVVADPQWTAETAAGPVSGSRAPMKIEIRRRGGNPELAAVRFEFTVRCLRAANQPVRLRWEADGRAGQLAFAGQTSATVGLRLRAGSNYCSIAVCSAAAGGPVDYYLEKMNLSPVRLPPEPASLAPAPATPRSATD
jgi:hypothetical protein